MDRSRPSPSSPRLPVCGSVQSDLPIRPDWTEPYRGPGSSGLVESLGRDEAAVRLLLDEPPTVNVDNKTIARSTVLLEVAGGGHEVITGLLLNLGADIHASNDFGSTALQLAASQGHAAIVRLLIEGGDNKYARDCSNGEYSTALHYAAKNGKDEIIRLLLDEAAADWDNRNEDVGNALRWVALKGHEVVVQLLLDDSNADYVN